MIAVAPSARQWRATLLAFLLLFLGLIIALAVLTERPPLDELPLRGVPEDEYARVGLVPVPAYDEYVAIDPGGVEFLARLIACCGRIRQIVLVRLHETDAGGAGTLTYAVNWDTSTAPESPPMGGHWRTSFTRDFEYFVTFLDAETGEHIYTLFPGSQFPWPPARPLDASATPPSPTPSPLRPARPLASKPAYSPLPPPSSFLLPPGGQSCSPPLPPVAPPALAPPASLRPYSLAPRRLGALCRRRAAAASPPPAPPASLGTPPPAASAAFE